MSRDTNATKGNLLKIGDAAGLLHVSAQTLRDWTDANKIKAVVSESGHRSYYEADVKKLALSEKGITKYWTANCIVAIPADKKKYYYVNPDTYEPAIQPQMYETDIDKFWNFNNGLQQQSHAVVLNDEPVIIPPGSNSSYLGEAFTLQLEEAGSIPLIAHNATVVGLDKAKTKALLSTALTQVIRYLEDNFTAQQTVVWLDEHGKLVED